MRTFLQTLLLAAVLLCLSPGCTVHRTGGGGGSGSGSGSAQCKHSDHCGHHWDGKRFVLVRGHVHKAGCGHAKKNGRWVIVVRR